MKNFKLLALSLASLLSLTGCVPKSINEDEYHAYRDATIQNINDNMPTNIHINDYSKTNVYDYKEGEFYSKRVFALILFVPISYGTYVWKDGDTYYRAETHTDSSKNTKSEISEELFTTYMLGFKESLILMMLEYTNKLDDIQEDDSHLQLTKNYYSISNGVRGVAKYTDGNGQKVTTTVEMKKNYIVKYTTKSDSKTGQYFDIGKAEFKEPNFNTESE